MLKKLKISKRSIIVFLGLFVSLQIIHAIIPNREEDVRTIFYYLNVLVGTVLGLFLIVKKHGLFYGLSYRLSVILRIFYIWLVGVFLLSSFILPAFHLEHLIPTTFINWAYILLISLVIAIGLGHGLLNFKPDGTKFGEQEYAELPQIVLTATVLLFIAGFIIFYFFR